MRENRVKRALAAGDRSLGTMIFEFPTTGIGRIAAAAGAEFLIYDMEHTGWSIETIRGLMPAPEPPIWCRWSASRPRNITSSRGPSTSGRWG